MAKIDMEAIKRLSVPERVQLVQDIWDTLRPNADELLLTEEQKEVIDRRLAEHRADPDSAIPWREVKARLEDAALDLPSEERADLAQRLLASLDRDPEVEAAWDEEIRRRLADLEAGRVKSISAEEVFAEIRRRLDA